MGEMTLLLVMAFAVVWWLDARRVQEIAVVRCREACIAAGLQFLDDVAPMSRLKLQRDSHGTLRLRRTFVFEYSTPLGERRRGFIVMIGRRPSTLELRDPDVRDNTH